MFFPRHDYQVICAGARGMTITTRESSTSSWLRCTQPPIGTGSTGLRVVSVWRWPPTAPRPRRWRRPITSRSIRRITSPPSATTAHLWNGSPPAKLASELTPGTTTSWEKVNRSRVWIDFFFFLYSGVCAGTDWRLTGSIRRTWHTTPTICISRRRTGRETRPALPFSTSRQPASARVSRQPYSISGSYSPPPRHRRPRRPPPPFCRHRRWITSCYCRWPWLQAASLVGDSFLPPYSSSLQVQQVKKWKGKEKKNVKEVKIRGVVVSLSTLCPPCTPQCDCDLCISVFKTKEEV